MPEPGNAATYRLRVNWAGAIGAGMIAGMVFLVMEMGLVAATGGEIWGPPRMMAAIVMGQGVLPPPATFDPDIAAVAMLVHFALSIVYALVAGWVIEQWGMGTGTAALAGAAFGLVLYLVNFYGFAALLFPWFATARNWIGIVSHLVYGGVLAWSYQAIAGRRRQPA